MERKSFYVLSFGFTFSTLNYKFLVLLCSYALVLFFRTKEFVRKNKLFMQNEPKFRKVKFNVTDLLKKNYEQLDTWSIRKNEPNTNPIRTQYEPNTNPIRTQYKPNTNPIQTQYKANSNPNKPNFTPI
jgi:hypothetical protein